MLLNAAGIPWHCYENACSHISAEQLSRLNAEICRLLDDQFMGYGHEAVSPALLDRVLIKILAQAKTLQELLLEWENFWNLVQNNSKVIGGFCKNEFIYRSKLTSLQRPGTYVWILYSTMLKLQLFSWMIGKQIKPKVIGIAEPASAAASDCFALLPAGIVFDQPHNFFSLDKDYLRSPVIRTHEECLNYKKYLPDDFFAIPQDERSFAVSVQRALKNTLKTEFRFPKIDRVAEELSVSVRGLSRKLEAEGASFQTLKRNIRRDLATDKLACTEMPVGNIAADLGFSETAAFSRAFKAWTASTPQEYRARLALRHPPK